MAARLSPELLEILLDLVKDSHTALVNLSHANRTLWHLSKRPEFQAAWHALNRSLTRHPVPPYHHMGARMRVIRFVSIHRLECHRCFLRRARPLMHIGIRLCTRCCKEYLLPVDDLVPDACVRFEWIREGSRRRRFARPEDLLRVLDATG